MSDLGFQQGSSGGNTSRERGRSRFRDESSIEARKAKRSGREESSRPRSILQRDEAGTREVSPPEMPPSPRLRAIPLPDSSEEGSTRSTEHDGQPPALQRLSDIAAKVFEDQRQEMPEALRIWREQQNREVTDYPSFGATIEQHARDMHALDEHARNILAIRASGDPFAIQFVEDQSARMKQDHPGLYAYLQWKIRELENNN